MGLGPSLCQRCRVFHKYVPHEQLGRQGYWICPINQYHAESISLFFIPQEEWDEIVRESTWIRSVE